MAILTSLSVAYSDATRSIPQSPQITASCAEDRPPASKWINPSIRGHRHRPHGGGVAGLTGYNRAEGIGGVSEGGWGALTYGGAHSAYFFGTIPVRLCCVSHIFSLARRRPDNKPLCRLSSQYYRDALFVDVVSLSNRIS
jgi:hypothetical protein